MNRMQFVSYLDDLIAGGVALGSYANRPKSAYYLHAKKHIAEAKKALLADWQDRQLRSIAQDAINKETK